MKEKLAQVAKWTLVIGIGGSLPMLKRGDYSGIYIVGGIVAACLIVGLLIDFKDKHRDEKRIN